MVVYDVILKSAGAQTQAVVKLVQERTGFDLKEAEELVKTAPKTLKENISIEEVVPLKLEFEKIGAKVEVKEHKQTVSSPASPLVPPGPSSEEKEFALAFICFEGDTERLNLNATIQDMITLPNITFIPDASEWNCDTWYTRFSNNYFPAIFAKDIKTTDYDPDTYSFKQHFEEEKVETEILWKNAKGQYRRTTDPDPNMHIWGVQLSQSVANYSSDRLRDFEERHPKHSYNVFYDRLQGITKAEAEEFMLIKDPGVFCDKLMVWDGEWMEYKENHTPKPNYPEALTDRQKPTAKQNLVYNGSKQALVNTPLEKLIGYTIKYKLGSAANFVTELPTATLAGKYTVNVRYEDDVSHEDFDSEDIIVTIEKAPLIITPDEGQYKEYGKEDPELTYKLKSPLYANDKLTGALELKPKEAKKIGIYKIVLGSLSAGSNYNTKCKEGVIFEIKKASAPVLTAEQKPTAKQNLVYNGTKQTLVKAPPGTPPEGYDAIKYKLKDETSFSDALPTAKNAGSYTVEFFYKGDSNHDDVKCEDIIVTIEKAPLTITPDAGQSKKSGEDDPKLTYTQDPAKLYANDKMDGALSYDEGSDVGEYEIRIGTLSAGDNYDIKLTPGIKFKITKADPNYPEALTASQKPTANPNLVYNGSDQELVIEPAELLPGYTIKYAIKPYFGTAKYSTAPPTAKNAKTYTVQVRYEDDSSHKVFDSEDIIVTIEKAPLIITPDEGQYKEYGEDDPELTYKLESPLYADDKLEGKLTRKEGKKIDKYDIWLGSLSAGDNYNIIFTKGVKFEIKKASAPVLTDRQKPTANQNLVYNGSNQQLVIKPAESLPNYTVKYKLANKTNFDKKIPTAKDAGTYTVNVKYIGGGNHSDFDDKDIVVTIDKAPLTITPDANQSKKFGEDDPDLTYTQIPAKLYAKEDKLDGALSRAEGEDVGEYDILVSNLSAGDNYDIKFTSGVKFAITEADVPEPKPEPEPDPEPWPDPEPEPDPTPGPTPGPIDNGEEYAVALVYCEGGMWSNPNIWDIINWNDVTFVPDITDMYADAPVMWMSLEHPTIFVKDIKTTDHDPNIFLMHEPSSEEEKVEIEILWKNAKGEYRRTTPPDPNMHIWGVRTKQETWSQSQNEKIDEFRSKYPYAFISQYAPRVQGITKAEAEELLDLLTKTKGKYEMLVWDGEWMKYSDKNKNYINMNNYNDLIPIKGISIAMKKALGKKKNIYDVGGLLSKGRTLNNRYAIAKDLGIDVRYVTLWLKQADLWRIPDMTPDDAYMLVLAGVRNISDLAKVDIEKLMPVLDSVVASHPDLPNPDRISMEKHIGVAQTLMSLKKDNAAIAPYALIVDEEKEPARLFKSGITKQNLPSDAQIINEGLRKLNDISVSLPLPRTISGQVKLKNEDGYISDYSDIKVELTGITSPSENDQETSSLFAYSNTTGYFSIVLPDKYNMQPTLTFTLSHGDNKQQFVKQASEVIDKTYIPNGGKLDGEVMYAKDLIRRFNDFDSINTGIASINQCLDDLKKISEKEFELKSKYDKGLIKEEELQKKLEALNKYKNEILKDCLETLEKIWKEVFHKAFEYKVEDLTEERLQKLLKELKQYRNEILKEIFGDLIDEDDFELSLTNLLSYTDLDSDVGDLIINFSVFMGIFNEKPKALPSVKLMGEDDKAIKLPTDTAPSRVFNYTMLQRLVEPSITKDIDNSEDKEEIAKVDRNPLEAPIDVSNFKINVAERPNSIPKMSSLGIGYTLKMHQAWVPDGFALGTLLYSTILAPGEEQRLILRENTQSYQVLDEAEGTDVVAEDYATTQDDDTTATYNYAVNQLMTGESSMEYSVKSNSVGLGFGFGGGYSGNGGSVGGSLGLSFGHSKTSGSASSSARQSNSHDEASSAAQSFQHCIKTASERISQAKRISMSSATSNETDSVATRIIANHNHSHAMTIQYWEVVRRYKLKTCIDGIDLVLFVPFDLIHFLPQGQPFYLKLKGTSNNDTENNQTEKNTPSIQGFDKEQFAKRYDVLLKHYDTLNSVLPSKYRTGLNLIQRYATYPDWRMEQVIHNQGDNNRQLELTITGPFLEFDNLKVTAYFLNGKSPVTAQLKETTNYVEHSGDGENSYNHDMVIYYEQYTISKLIDRLWIKTTKELKDIIIEKKSEKFDITRSYSILLPRLTTKDDIASIRIEYSCSPLKYHLSYGKENVTEDSGEDDSWTSWERDAVANYRKYKRYLYENNEDSAENRADIAHYYEGLPDNYRVNEVNHGATLSSSDLKALGPFRITEIALKENEKGIEGIYLSTNILQYNTAVIEMPDSVPVLRYDELQKMELTLHHVASETMRYSQIVWSRLTADERALLLEQYTVSLGSGRTSDREGSYYNEFWNKMNDIHIPLLNCINVKKVLGYYGNCMLFPFTYPQELAEKLGKTAAELQDALYRYHTSSFRVPSTVISLPTRGMIGEAVLGETNVSEEIDLTRFWNWQDSPIDKMEIDDKYLNNTDYLASKATKDISPLNLQGASATSPVTVPDLISALVSKQTPQFNDITGLDQTTSILTNATDNNTKAQLKVLDNSTNLATKALEYVSNQQKGDKDQKGGGKDGGGKDGGGKDGGGKDGGGNGGGNDKSDYDDFFEDVNIEEFGLTDLNETDTKCYKCLMALASARGDEKYSRFKEYQRIQEKMKKEAEVEKLEPNNRFEFITYAGALIYKYGLSKEEINKCSETIAKKFGL